MKKLFLFVAMAAFTLTSCSKDDDDNKTYTLNSDYLFGNWVETDPTNYIFSFDESTATLTDLGEPNTQDYNYSTEEGKLILVTPDGQYTSTFDIEIVDKDTLKLTSLYPSFACVGCPKTVSTFKRAEFAPNN
ncbi:hypothetical protein [Flavobacterium rhizosphaerae]|uniref:Lipocalin-like domain-containing protein n=1 Tax=Flavobacterium rhizosphaerae TaxID=3163298 RepID=A0ABW8YZC9_9FLAO